MSLFVFFCCLYIYVNGSGSITSVGKRELICLLLFTCNYVVSVLRGFLFLWVLGMGYVVLLWHPLSLPYNIFFKHPCIFHRYICVMLITECTYNGLTYTAGDLFAAEEECGVCTCGDDGNVNCMSSPSCIG